MISYITFRQAISSIQNSATPMESINLQKELSEMLLNRSPLSRNPSFGSISSKNLFVITNLIIIIDHFVGKPRVSVSRPRVLRKGISRSATQSISKIER